MTKRIHLLLALALIAALGAGALVGCTAPTAGTHDAAAAQPEGAKPLLTGPALYEFYTDW